MAYRAAWGPTGADPAAVVTTSLAGDYMIAGCSYDGGGISISVTGYTAVTGSPQSVTTFDGQIVFLFYKALATANETVTFTGNFTWAWVMALSGRDTTAAPEQMIAQKKDDGAQSSPWGGTTGAFTPTAGADLVGVLHSDCNTGSDNAAYTFSDSVGATWTTRIDSHPADFYDYGVGVSENVAASSRTVSCVGTLGGADAEWIQWVLSVKAASAGGSLTGPLVNQGHLVGSGGPLMGRLVRDRVRDTYAANDGGQILTRRAA